MKNRVVIFGASGFIGSSLSSYLKSKGMEVLELGRSTATKIDFNSIDTWVNLIQEHDYIIHLISPKETSEEEAHFIATRELLEKAKQSKASHFLYLSSGGAIYGRGDQEWKETDPLNPVSPYGKFKKRIEELITSYCQDTALPFCIARPSNVYGENQKFEKQFGAVTTFFHNINQGLPINIFGSLNICKDYLHVSDLNIALETILLQRKNGIYNLGSGQNYSLQEIISEVELITQKKAVINFLEGSTVDITLVKINSSKANKELNWKATINLKEALILYKRMYFKT